MTVSEGRLKSWSSTPKTTLGWKRWLSGIALWCFVSRYRTAIERTRCKTMPERQVDQDVYDLLDKEGIHVRRSERGDKVYDRIVPMNWLMRTQTRWADVRVYCRPTQQSRLAPRQASEYHWWSVQELLRSAVYHDRSTAAGCAKYWKAQGNELAGYRAQADGKRAYAEARRAVVRAAGEATSGQLASRSLRSLIPLNASELATVRQ